MASFWKMLVHTWASLKADCAFWDGKTMDRKPSSCPVVSVHPLLVCLCLSFLNKDYGHVELEPPLPWCDLILTDYIDHWPYFQIRQRFKALFGTSTGKLGGHNSSCQGRVLHSKFLIKISLWRHKKTIGVK